MGVNHPSIESSHPTTVRKIMPHTTSLKREKGRKSVRSRVDARGEGGKKI
jgi:hypothetical protein